MLDLPLTEEELKEMEGGQIQFLSNPPKICVITEKYWKLVSQARLAADMVKAQQNYIIENLEIRNGEIHLKCPR